MNHLTDQQLLRDYASKRSETAFAELTRRHVDFVYSAARRMVCDAHLAEDVTQNVFMALSKSADQLTNRPVLSGWLHRTAQNLAANVVRTEVRRRAREQEAVAMNQLLTHETEPGWENIAPHLDAALSELSEPDRDALLLRYFEKKSAREMAAVLNVSEEAAQKRVNRTVERLRELFSKRNVTIGASGLAVLISANAVQAAPVGLALSISAAAALVGTTLQTSTVIVATKTIAMTTLQKTLIAAAAVVVTGAGIIEMRHSVNLQKQIEKLLQQQAPAREKLEEWQREHEDTAKKLTELREDNELLKRNTSELLKLRGEIGLLRDENSRLRKSKEGNIENQRPRVVSHDLKFQNPYLGKDEWQNQGAEHPDMALETMFWAIKQGDQNKLEQLVLRKDEKQSLDSLILPKSYWDKVSEVQIIDVNIISNGSPQKRAMIGTIVEKQPVESVTGEMYNPTSIRRWFLIETNGAWRVTGGG